MFYKLTRNVFIQGNDLRRRKPLPWTDPVAGVTSSINLRKGTHLVPFFRSESKASEVQLLTAASIHAAKAVCGDGIKLASATLHAELSAVPQGFEVPRALERTILDVHGFQVPRPLPLLFDILDIGAAVAHDDDDYLIFSNADICLQPHFYASVRSLLGRGFDCLIVNRRTVADVKEYQGYPECAAFEVGKRHPGADCFVFPAQWCSAFVRSDACIGMGYVTLSLLYNLIARADSLLILEDAPLTYHYGDEVPWTDARYADYFRHNERAGVRVFSQLAQQPAGRERLRDFCRIFNLPYPGAPSGTSRRGTSRWRRLFRRSGP